MLDKDYVFTIVDVIEDRFGTDPFLRMILYCRFNEILSENQEKNEWEISDKKKNVIIYTRYIRRVKFH